MKRLLQGGGPAVVWLIVALTSLLLSRRALAGDTKAAAEALFVEGRNLMIQQRYDEACPKFEASQRLDPGLGTMLNLADCYEKSGRTASAWAQYREVIPAARAAGSDERAALAEERARALESRLSTLTIRLLGEMKGVDLQVLRDGLPVDSAALSTPIPVDPGRHEIVAQAPGHQAWSTQAEVGSDADQVVVEIPALTTTSSAEAGKPSAEAGTGDRGTSWPAQKTWGLVAGGVGVLGLGAGGVFAAVAGSELSAAKATCPTYPDNCSVESINHNQNAQTFADAATVSLIVGGASLALGAVLWLTAPSKSSTRVGLGLGTIEMKGTF